MENLKIPGLIFSENDLKDNVLLDACRAMVSPTNSPRPGNQSSIVGDLINSLSDPVLKGDFAIVKKEEIDLATDFSKWMGTPLSSPRAITIKEEPQPLSPLVVKVKKEYDLAMKEQKRKREEEAEMYRPSTPKPKQKRSYKKRAVSVSGDKKEERTKKKRAREQETEVLEDPSKWVHKGFESLDRPSGSNGIFYTYPGWRRRPAHSKKKGFLTDEMQYSCAKVVVSQCTGKYKDSALFELLEKLYEHIKEHGNEWMDEQEFMEKFGISNKEGYKGSHARGKLYIFNSPEEPYVKYCRPQLLDRRFRIDSATSTKQNRVNPVYADIIMRAIPEHREFLEKCKKSNN